MFKTALNKTDKSKFLFCVTTGLLHYRCVFLSREWYLKRFLRNTEISHANFSSSQNNFLSKYIEKYNFMTFNFIFYFPQNPRG